MKKFAFLPCFILVARGVLALGLATAQEAGEPASADDAFGRLFRRAGTVALTTPDSLAVLSVSSLRVDAENRIYIADAKSYAVHVFDSTGGWLRSFGRRGQGPKEFKSPSSLAFTPAGEVLVGDTGNKRLSIWSSDGEFVRVVPLERSPSDLAFTRDARLVVLTYSAKLCAVYNAQFELQSEIGEWRDLPREFTQKYRMPIRGGSFSLDHHGHIYFAFVGKYLIRKFDLSGTLLAEFGRQAPFYRAPTAPPAELSPQKIQAWQESWTPILKVLATQEGRLLVQIRTYKQNSDRYDSKIDVYDLEGNLLQGGLECTVRLETQAPNGDLYFIETREPDEELEIRNPVLHRYRLVHDARE